MGIKCSTYAIGEMNNAYTLFGKFERRPLRSPRRRWENIRIDLSRFHKRLGIS
jgi:hypothetical protein